MTPLAAPFPWFGGKARWAEEVWCRFGKADVYVEPFAGSLAVLLANPEPARREIVCDTNGHLCNLWRSLQADPEATAYWADYPTIHQDLTARHKWLRQWGAENGPMLSEDCDYYDPKAAGWWVWGISLWIGSGWCSNGTATVDGGVVDGRPYVGNKEGARGVAAQRRDYHDKRPWVSDKTGYDGRGVSAQRPIIDHKGGGRGSGGQGIAQQTARSVGIYDWFDALQARLKRVVVLNRDWTSAVTSTVLSDTPSGPRERINRCIVLDPPYRTERRKGTLYDSDFAETSDDTAEAAYKWAVENGERYRIVYFCHAGDFDLPAGWHSLDRDFSGSRRSNRDQAMFSPACVEPQPDLFSTLEETT